MRGHAERFGMPNPPKRIIATGGASSNESILKSIAQIFGCPVFTVQRPGNCSNLLPDFGFLVIPVTNDKLIYPSMAAKLTPSLFQIQPRWVQRWEPPTGGCATPKEASSPSRACTRATWRRPPLVRSLQSQPERRRKIGSFWRSTPYWWVRGWRSRDVWWRRLGGHRKVVICEALLHLSGHEELWIIVTIISYANSPVEVLRVVGSKHSTNLVRQSKFAKIRTSAFLASTLKEKLPIPCVTESMINYTRLRICLQIVCYILYFVTAVKSEIWKLYNFAY